MNSLISLGEKARIASRALALAGTREKNLALEKIAKSLKLYSAEIIKANEIDLENGRKSGLSKSLLDRLALSEDRISSMADGVLALCQLPEPVGIIKEEYVRPNGIKIKKITVPFGVIGIIY